MQRLFSLVLLVFFIAPFSQDRSFYYGATTTSSYITMRDGVKIAVDVMLPRNVPKGARLPTILDLTRYWRNNSEGPQSLYFVAHGYAMVVIDVRGTGASTGMWSAPFSRDEIADDRSIVDWVVAQPWCNGNIGAIGTSYEGGAAQFLAVSDHPAVKAVIPRFQEFDEYTDLAFPGGIFADSPVKRWQEAIHQLDSSANVKPVDQDKNARTLRDAIKEHSRNIDVYKSALNITYRDDKADAQGHTLNSISVPAYQNEIERSKAAIYGWGSWMDAATADAVIRRFLNFNNPQKAMIGTWNHGGSQNASPYASNLTANAPQLAECLRYFDYYLKGLENGVGAEHELVYYTMGEEKWKSTTTWPPAGVTPQDWYFGERHMLSESAPIVPAGADDYKVDFEATTGKTNRWQTEVGGGPVIYADRASEDGKLLTYTSGPLPDDLEITGTPIVDLYVSSTHADGAFFVYLEEVDESGTVTYLTEGELRAIHRRLSDDAPLYKMLTPFHSFTRKDSWPLIQGQAAELKFGLLTTSTLVRKGHRIRVAIAGADKDTFARIPAEGTPQISVLRNAEHASRIQIPVIRKSNEPQTADPWQKVYSTLGMTGGIASGIRPRSDATPQEATLQTAAQVIDRYVKAVGGEAVTRISTRLTSGFRINSNGTDDSFDSYFEHPDKAYYIRRFPFGTLLSGSIGQDSWDKVNDEPARLVKDASPPKANAPEYVIQGALHFRELYSDMKLKGMEKTAEGSVYVIEATNTDGNPAKLCFDAQTGLLACSIQKRQVQTMSSGKNGWTTQKVIIDVETWYADYRNIDGVMTPFFINTKTASGVTTTIYTQLKNNVAIDDAVFKMPK